MNTLNEEWDKLEGLAYTTRDAVMLYVGTVDHQVRLLEQTQATLADGFLQAPTVLDTMHAFTTARLYLKQLRYACELSHRVFEGSRRCVRVWARRLDGPDECLLVAREVDVRDSHDEFTPGFGVVVLMLSIAHGCAREFQIEVDPE